MLAAVTSRVRDLPLHHEMREQPSGRLPSESTRPDGSLVAGIPGASRARKMQSFSAWCLAARVDL